MCLLHNLYPSGAGKVTQTLTSDRHIDKVTQALTKVIYKHWQSETARHSQSDTDPDLDTDKMSDFWQEIACFQTIVMEVVWSRLLVPCPVHAGQWYFTAGSPCLSQAHTGDLCQCRSRQCTGKPQIIYSAATCSLTTSMWKSTRHKTTTVTNVLHL